MKGFSWLVALVLVAALVGSTLGIYWKNPANRPAILQGTTIERGLTAGESAQVSHLAELFGTMDPKAVAAIIYASDPRLAASVLIQMPNATAGKILAAMPPDEAAKLINLMSEGG